MSARIYLIIIGVVSSGLMSATPITFLTSKDINVRGGLKINTPGLYVLNEDVVFTQQKASAITISSDDVTIDLNGRTLKANAKLSNGINIVARFKAPNNFNDIYNIVIKNGTLDNFDRFAVFINGGERYVTVENVAITNIATSSFGAQIPAGIFINGNSRALVSEVVIKKCHVIGGRYGLLALFANNVTVVDSSFSEAFASGASLLQSNLWDIRNCSFSNEPGRDGSGSAGLLARGGSLLTIKNCEFSRNNATPGAGSMIGLSLIGLPDGPSGSHIVEDCTFNNNRAANLASGVQLISTNSCVFRDCIANANFSSGAQATGFSIISGSEGNLFERCIANANFTVGPAALAAGFNITGSANNIIDCVAKENFSSGAGGGHGFFTSSTAPRCLVQNCLATGNNTFGFRNDSTSAFIGNFATANGTNFGGSGTIGFLTVVNGAQPVGGSFDERQIDNIEVV